MMKLPVAVCIWLVHRAVGLAHCPVTCTVPAVVFIMTAFTLTARGSRILTILKEILAEQRSIRRMIEFIMMHEGIVYEEETVLPREE